jgi:hypothetical protein
MQTFAKLRAPLFGRGKLNIIWERAFKRADPVDRMSMLNQAMRQMRDEYAKAEADHRIARQHEDARNAEAITARSA